MKPLEKATIDTFKAHVRAAMLLPGAAGYDEARQIWNAMIVRCTSPEEVVQAVDFARTHPLRGGRHRRWPSRARQRNGQC